MSSYTVLSRKKHANLKIKVTNQLKWALNDNICEIYVDEALLCSESLPIAFIKTQDSEKREYFKLIALCGLLRKKNEFLNEKLIWTGSYIPAIYRSYPFKIFKEKSESNKKILCIDTDNDLITEDKNENNIDLFEKNGEPTKFLKKMMEFVSSLEHSLLKTLNLTKLLASLDLLEEWKITVKTKDEEVHTKGLYKINKEKIKNLSKEDLFELHKNNGLELIFSHYLSKRNIQKFNKFENDNILDNGVNIRDLKNEVKIKQEKEKIKEVESLVQNLLKEE